MSDTATPDMEPDLSTLTDDEVAAAARAFWLDDLCDRRDQDHDEADSLRYDW